MKEVAIIGAGVIGVSAALLLAREGHRVTLFEREAVAAGASGGNAGAFAFSDIIPLAAPGVLRNVPRWLGDPLGPLAIPASYSIRILPWLLRFWRASRPGRYAAARDAQVALMDLSRAALERLLHGGRLGHLVRREGQLQLYDTARSFEASLAGWEDRRRAGIAFRTLSGPGAIAEIQPGLSPQFRHGVFTPDWINVSDPKLWVETLAEEAKQAGVAIERRAVDRLHPSETGVVVTCGSDRFHFDRAVLAAGAHSGALLRGITPPLPLETERGYNTTFAAGAFDLRTHVSFADHAFVVTRIGEAIRVGGAVELGGLRLPANMDRARHLREKATTFMPDLPTSPGTEWMGFRPSMPDSLPVIGRAPNARSVLLAFGHGHLGLTQSVATAELLCDLVEDRPTRIDLTPFRPERFRGVLS